MCTEPALLLMRFLVAIALVVLLAGCNQPPVPAPVEPVATLAPAPTYGVTVRVSQETPDGPAMHGAMLQVGLLNDDGTLLGTPMLRSTDHDGRVQLSWSKPVVIAVQAVAADAKAWTAEGGRIAVGETVQAQGLLASERDVFVPLYRSSLTLSAASSLSTAVAQPRPDGMLDPIHAEADLAFPDGLQAAYLARLAKARVVLAWEDTATSRADLAAGLAWDGQVWVSGADPSPGIVPAARSSEFQGDLPSDRPRELASARLQATAISRTAVVGDVPLAFTVELGFGDLRPMELPDPRCDHRAAEGAACLIPLA